MPKVNNGPKPINPYAKIQIKKQVSSKSGVDKLKSAFELSIVQREDFHKKLKTQTIILPLQSQGKQLAQFEPLSSIAPRLALQTPENPYAARVLSGRRAQPNASLIVHIPTAGDLSLDLTLELTAEGLVNLCHLPEELTLALSTVLSVKTTQDFRNRDFTLRAQELLNSHQMSAEVVMSVTAFDQILNSGSGLIRGESVTLILDDPSTGRIKNAAMARIMSEQSLLLQAAEIENEGLISGALLVLTAKQGKGKISNLQDARIKSDHSIKLHALRLCNEGEISPETEGGSKLKVEIETITFENPGILKARELTAIVTHWVNTATGQVVTGDQIDMDARDVTNLGYIEANGKLQISAEKIVNKGLAVSNQDLHFKAAKFLKNSGDMVASEAVELNNEALFLNTGKVMASKRLQVKASNRFSQLKQLHPIEPYILELQSDLDNMGLLSGESVSLSTPVGGEIRNFKGARIEADNTLQVVTSVFHNEGAIGFKSSGDSELKVEIETATQFNNANVIRAHVLNATTPYLVNSGRIETSTLFLKAKEGFADQFENSGEVTAESVTLWVNNLQNKGDITTRSLDIRSQKFAHTQGIIKAGSVCITGKDIQITSPIEAEGDIEIFHQGGKWEVAPDMLRTKGKVIIHWKEAPDAVPPLQVLGSLKYVLDKEARKPLRFLENQPVPGDFEVDAPSVPVVIGDEHHTVKLGSDPSRACNKIELRGKTIDLVQAQLRCLGDLTLRAEALTLGRRSGPLYNRSVLQSGGLIRLGGQSARSMVWNQMVIEGRDLFVQASHLDNISSRLWIQGDAEFAIETSEHRLLIETRDLGGQSFLDSEGHAEQYFEYQQAETPSAQIQIAGKLRISGQTRLFGSQLYCGTFEGTRPELVTFTPSEAWKRQVFSKELASWQSHQGTTEGAPFQGVFHVGAGLKPDSKTLSEISFQQAMTLRGIRQSGIAPLIFLRDHNPKGLVASLFFKLSSSESSHSLLEVWVSHRSLGELPLCLSGLLSTKESKELAEHSRLTCSSLKGFELLTSKLQASLRETSVQLASGALKFFDLPSDQFSYAFETSGTLELDNISSTGGEIAILRASRVKLRGNLEAGLGLFVQSILFDTRGAKVRVPQGKCIFQGREGQAMTWFNDKGRLEVDEIFEVDARRISNRRGHIQVGVLAEKTKAGFSFQARQGFDNREGVLTVRQASESSFKVGMVRNHRGVIKLSGKIKHFSCSGPWLHGQGASFVSEQALAGIIGELRVTGHSVFRVEDEAELTVERGVICRDYSSLSALKSLKLLADKIVNDETGLVKGNWPLFRAVPLPQAATTLIAKKAILEAPLVGSKVRVKTREACHLLRGAYAQDLYLDVQGQFTYGIVDAVKRLRLFRPGQDCQLERSLNTRARVHLKGQTTGATQAPLTAKEVIFQATSSRPYPIQLSQRVSAWKVTYQGKGLEQTQDSVEGRTVYFEVDNLNIHPRASHFGEHIETRRPLTEVHRHEYAFNATHHLILRFREGRVEDTPLLNIGALTYEIAKTATLPQSFQAPLISGAYPLYLDPYHPADRDLSAPSLKELEESRQLPLLVRRGNRLWVLGLDREGEKRLTLLSNEVAGHPLFSDLPFNSEHRCFRGESRMMTEFYRLFREKNAHIVSNLPLTLLALSVPVTIGRKENASPTSVHALHGQVIVDTLRLNAEYPLIYGKEGSRIRSEEAPTFGYPIPRGDKKPYSEARFEGPFTVQTGASPVRFYSTLLETVGRNGDFRIEAPPATPFYFQGGEARIGGKCYFPGEAYIELGTASQPNSYTVWETQSYRSEHRVAGIGRHHKDHVTSVLVSKPCTEQWATTERANFKSAGTVFCTGVKVLGSEFHTKQLLALDKKTACELQANHFAERRVVEKARWARFGKGKRSTQRELQTLQIFPARVNARAESDTTGQAGGLMSVTA